MADAQAFPPFPRDLPSLKLLPALRSCMCLAVLGDCSRHAAWHLRGCSGLCIAMSGPLTGSRARIGPSYKP